MEDDNDDCECSICAMLERMPFAVGENCTFFAVVPAKLCKKSTVVT